MADKGLPLKSDETKESFSVPKIPFNSLAAATSNKLLTSLAEGVTELICHPGSGENALDNQYKHWGYDFENELKALSSSEAREAIRKKGIILTNFFHLSNALTHGS